MLTSSVRSTHGNPTLYVENQLIPAMAYTTYFEERSACKEFADAGYRIFFVNISMTAAPINSAVTGFTPFRVGVFENPDEPDYSEFECAVEKILAACPDAILFPRIYVSMPKWWVDTHPHDVVTTPKGGYREILFSDAFRRDGGELLTKIVHHIQQAPYAHRIAGWQLCGGQTQEWFHHNLFGSLCQEAEEPYRRWVARCYGEENATIPSAEAFRYQGNAVQEDENARRYSLFCNLGVAESLEYFANVVKKLTNYEQVVGAFYGYSFENNNTVLFGSHGLRRLLDSPNLDFFSSPNAYTDKRAFGIDWADMMPVDSLKHHGKLCFVECDVRTYLTSAIQLARPGEYPDDIYKTKTGESVWSGPPTAELSQKALRKCFAHQITKASAIWWFDMWGGWYRDPSLMEELVHMKHVYEAHISRNAPKLPAQIVFFADESGYANMLNDSPQLRGFMLTRRTMGNLGAPYDTCMVEDAPAVLSNYRLAVFPFPCPSEEGKRAMALCEELGIRYVTATPDHWELTAQELQDAIRESGVHSYAEAPDVIYVGNGYVGLHSLTGGQKTIKLPKEYAVSPIFGAQFASKRTDTLCFELDESGTALFSIDECQ